jgi:ribose-phosphate pyrophosphokinase
MAIIDKRRPEPNKAEVMNIIGDVTGRDVIVLDDMVDTAGTLTETAKALKESGAKNVHAYATHAVLSGNAVEKIENSNLVDVTLTDTLPLSESASGCSKIRVLSISRLLGEAIKRIHRNESVSSLFI